MTPIPAGWKLVPIEPTPEMLEAARRAPLPAVMVDSRSATENLQHKAAYAAMLGAVTGSPASVAPGDAQAVAWMDPETLDVISAERKASWLSNYGIGGANKAARYTRALGDFRPAPAAGDAVDAARYRFLRRNTAPLRLAEQMGIPRKQVKRSDDPAARVDEMCDAALAAQPTTKGKT